MEIQEKLQRFKFHIIGALAFSFSIIFFCYLAPTFLDILKYFSPLLVSTALFLIAIVVFDRTSPLTDNYSGEGLLDYVSLAGEVEPVVAVTEVEECVNAN